MAGVEIFHLGLLDRGRFLHRCVGGSRVHRASVHLGGSGLHRASVHLGGLHSKMRKLYSVYEIMCEIESKWKYEANVPQSERTEIERRIHRRYIYISIP